MGSMAAQTRAQGALTVKHGHTSRRNVRLCAVKKQSRRSRGGVGGADVGGTVHLSATIRASEESSQERIAHELREGLEEKTGTVSALPDRRTVLLSTEYSDETSCMKHVDAEIMPMFKMVRPSCSCTGYFHVER